jgi:hypothetical protein
LTDLGAALDNSLSSSSSSSSSSLSAFCLFKTNLSSWRPARIRKRPHRLDRNGQLDFDHSLKKEKNELNLNIVSIGNRSWVGVGWV